MRIRTARDIGAVIRAARKRAGLTQSELASRIGAGTRWVSLIENGSPVAELGRVLRALQILGIELDAATPDRPSPSDHCSATELSAADELDAIIRAHLPEPHQ
jgi:y4mF family transcriptional regulator